jgi:hypothetical protein
MLRDRRWSDEDTSCSSTGGAGRHRARSRLLRYRRSLTIRNVRRAILDQVVPAEDPVAIRTAIPGQRSIAAEISSVIDEVPPIEVTPPEAVFR